MNKKTFLLGLVAISAAFVLSGCSNTASNSQSNSTPQQQQDAGYIQSMLETKEKAKQNVQSAQEKENQKIQSELNETNENTMDLAKQYNKAILKTSKGDITVELFTKESPKTSNNFLKLASDKFYDGTAFHRVIKDFMIQGGDPLSKNSDWSRVGTGGPGYTFADEINSQKLVRGSLAMANSGPNTNGSQFFIVTADSTPWLDGKHTNFGKVTQGMSVVDAIENSATNQMDQPLEKIIIKSIELIK